MIRLEGTGFGSFAWANKFARAKNSHYYDTYHTTSSSTWLQNFTHQSLFPYSCPPLRKYLNVASPRSRKYWLDYFTRHSDNGCASVNMSAEKIIAGSFLGQGEISHFISDLKVNITYVPFDHIHSRTGQYCATSTNNDEYCLGFFFNFTEKWT